MKKLITSILAIALMYSASAQISVGINGGMVSPTAEGSESHIGFNIFAKYNLSEKMRLGVNFGNYSKSYDLMGIDVKSIISPITATFEYSFSTNSFSPYAGIDAGIYQMGASLGGVTVKESYLGLAPVVGADYNLSDKLAINANFKYHYIMSEGEATSAIGINAGVCYKF